MRPRYGPATIRLFQAGLTVTQVADALGTERPTVSRWLSGQRSNYPPELLDAIAELGGRELADDVAALIPGAPRPRAGDAA